MRTQLSFALIAAAFACSFHVAPAQARARTFVASYGNDSNPCTFLSPCRNFQQAVNVVDAGGEVTAIDSAGFGPISITKAVTITSPDGVEAGIVPVAGGDAIDISAGPSDAIVLRGLTLDGAGVGLNGIAFSTGSSVTITNCVVAHSAYNGHAATGNGILIQPPSGSAKLTIANTIIANNANRGIYFLEPQFFSAQTVNVVVDHVTVTGNFVGLELPSFAGGTVVAVSNTTVSSNFATGLAVGGSGLYIIDNVTSVENGGVGIDAIGASTVLLSRSVIAGNLVGIQNETSPNTFYTYGNNLIDFNSSANIGNSPLNTSTHLQ